MKKMLTKLKMSLTNNIGLKFLAVLIALVLWLAIVNVNDPRKPLLYQIFQYPLQTKVQ